MEIYDLQYQLLKGNRKNLIYSSFYARQTHSRNKNFLQGSSLRVALLKETAEKLNISQSEHIGFYEVKEEIVLRKSE